MIITKVKKSYLDVPKIPKEDIIKRGLYTLEYNGDIIKVGIYGEGVRSNNKTRFSSYRSMGKNIKPGNGSYKTMKIINENIKVGDIIKVNFIKLPEDRFIDGYWWKVDLYFEEDKLKNSHKNTLWLN
jgi:hypothetical protein|tara:strand:+ start:130 stop:510 length:381 start_codon:yes stop_codon:yes gene_type:complete